MPKKRLFVALNLPLPVREMLGGCIDTIQEQNRHIRVKWVETENLHLTLHFLGDIEEDMVGDIKEIIKQAGQDITPLQVELGKLIGFPDSRRPKIVCVELKERQGKLLKLYNQLKSGLLNHGFEIDLKPFKPHITLGRVKVPQVFKGLDIPVIDSQFIIRSVELMESELLANGPKYTILCQTFLE